MRKKIHKRDLKTMWYLNIGILRCSLHFRLLQSRLIEEALRMVITSVHESQIVSSCLGDCGVVISLHLGHGVWNRATLSMIGW